MLYRIWPTLTLGALACSKPPTLPQVVDASASEPRLSVTLPLVTAGQRFPIAAFSFPSTNPSPDALAECASTGTGLPLAPAIIHASPNGPLTFAGEVVGQLDARGQLDPGEIDGEYYHIALGDRLSELRERIDRVSEYCRPWASPDEVGDPSRLLFAVDTRIPGSTLRALLYTAGRASYSEYFMLVEDPGAASRAPMHKANPSGGKVNDLFFVLPTPHNLTIDFLGTGTEPVHQVVPCPEADCAGGYATEEMVSLGTSMMARGPAGRFAIFGLHSGVLWGHLAGVLDGIARAGFPSAPIVTFTPEETAEVMEAVEPQEPSFLELEEYVTVLHIGLPWFDFRRVAPPSWNVEPTRP
ncbi:MAG: hypothetical protein AAGA48_20880 [Myxococcota bacterium]